MSQFGLTPFGVGPFGGPGQMALLGMLTAARNELVAVFDVPPKADDTKGYRSATNIKNWTLAAIDPRIQSTADPDVFYTPSAEAVPQYTPRIIRASLDATTELQIHLYLDAPMEEDCSYDIEAINVEGAACETPTGALIYRVRALYEGPIATPRYIQEDRYRDWASEPFPPSDDSPPGSWVFDESGDVGIHGADASLRKRIFRRLLANPGEFAHLPAYGVGVLELKRLLRPGAVQTLANRAAEQAKKEPDVINAGVSATLIEVSGGTLLRLDVHVQRRDARDSRFVFDFPTR